MIIVNFKNPTVLVMLILMMLGLVFFFLLAFGIVITTGQMMLFMALLIGGLGVLFYLLLQNKGEDPMLRARIYAIENIESLFHCKISLKEWVEVRTYYDPDTNPFFGFIFRRDSGTSLATPISIVLHYNGNNFNIVKTRALSENEAVKADPFIILGGTAIRTPVSGGSLQVLKANALASQGGHPNVAVYTGNEKKDNNTLNEVVKK